MKVEKKKEAIFLRKQGKSIGEIESTIGCSRSSVSRWVRDVVLTQKQKQRLQERNPIYNQQLRGGKHNKENWRKKRQGYQDEGRATARQKNLFHLAGCMLYWAEGTKSRNQIGFSNSDPNMVSFFVRFLRSSCGVDESNIKLQVNCYDDMKTVEQIEDFWLCLTGLNRSALTKTMVNHKPKSSRSFRKGKLEHGVCQVRVSESRILQQIYGAIQEYIQFENLAWLE